MTSFFVCIIIGYGGVFEESPDYQQAAVRLATQKAQNPGWYQIFLRAIGANWLVCFAVFISISSREVVSKIIAICELLRNLPACDNLADSKQGGLLQHSSPLR